MVNNILQIQTLVFGSGKIYTVLEQFSSVLDDMLCVGQRHTQCIPKNVCWVKLTPRLESEMLVERLSVPGMYLPTYLI